mgnify:CR=1 FL=1
MNRIKELRKEKNITVKELAEVLGISQSMLSNYENGNSAPRNQGVWKELANFFKVDTGFVMGISDIRNISEIDERSLLSNVNSTSKFDFSKALLNKNLKKLHKKDIDSMVIEDPKLADWLQGVLFTYESLFDTKEGINDFDAILEPIVRLVGITGYFHDTNGESEADKQERRLKFLETKNEIMNKLDKFYETGENPIYVLRDDTTSK